MQTPLPDLETLSLHERTDLQDRVSKVMRRRFERVAAVTFTDVVGSTEYVVRHGAVAGRAQLQRSHSLLEESLEGSGGRIVDTAGDGSFCIFPDAADAAASLVTLMRLAARASAGMEASHQLQLRAGLHEGPVLVDDERVSGDTVHYAARVSSSAVPGELRLSEEAHRALPAMLRTRCKRGDPVTLKGFPGQATLYTLDWRDPERFPRAVRNDTTGEVLAVPFQDRVSFGRLDQHEGQSANDVVLVHPDPDRARRISRWHFELVRGPEAYVLRVLSRAGVQIGDEVLKPGDSADILPGTELVVAGAIKLTFLAALPGFDDRTFVGG
jgi:class 3 adenylate cyclase